MTPGKKTTFSYLQGYRNDPTQKDKKEEVWTVIGPSMLTISGVSVSTVVVTRDIQTFGTWDTNAWRWTYQYDPVSGVWLKGDPELLRGSVSGLTPFKATSLSAP